MNYHVFIYIILTFFLKCELGDTASKDQGIDLPISVNPEPPPESFLETEVVEEIDLPQLLVQSKTLNTFQEDENYNLLLEEDKLFVSTLDGSLFAISKNNGLLKWKVKGDPIVKVPWDASSKSVMPIILPDPKDGSLYFVDERESDILRKLPFTISELVAASPYKANDGFLYLGKKSDTWFSLDPYTGQTFDTITMDGKENFCPFTSGRTIYFGKTEYNVMMYDNKNKRQWWNITYFDYSSIPMTKDIAKEYNMIHFGASSTGVLLTVDRKTSSVMWKRDFGSPIVGIYFLKQEAFVKVPFTSLSLGTLNHLEARLMDINFKKESMYEDAKQFYPTLYIGKHSFGLYALPALVDCISKMHSNSLLLIDGPTTVENVILQETGDSEDVQTKQDYFILGYHKLPTNPESWSSSILRITYEENETEPSDKKFLPGKDEQTIPTSEKRMPPPKSPFYEGISKLVSFNTTFIFSHDFLSWTFSSLTLLYTHDHLFFKIVITVLLIAIIFMLNSVYPKIKEYEKVSSRHSNMSTGSDTGGYQITAEPEDLGDGKIKIGRITFSSSHLLGKGCEGTFVYKGWFDRRDVAVKRLLPECFTVADREVDILRESDAHPNVIRYFCMEQDRQFRYIALELCAYNLQHYVEGISNKVITTVDVLEQSTAGLAHLHSLNIVHRDIKPQNVLLSYPDARGQVRVMISDFGLCKKLSLGKMSFSKRSGLAGTDGWIAPEMVEGSRATFMVDIFSLGCVFYYVLTNGRHPFGDALRRQANIISDNSDLSHLDNDSNILLHDLVEKMISKDINKRPPASSILKHPAFWKNDAVLRFFQDVSDRVEKEKIESPILQNLERHSWEVVKGDWRDHIDDTVSATLRKYRAYKGRSVRDLLRALRNKKHHYHELPEEARCILGRIPDDFVSYWTNRFPRLLLHTWYALQSIKSESICRPYYDPHYDFIKKEFPRKLWKVKSTELESDSNDSTKVYLEDSVLKDESSPLQIVFNGKICDTYSLSVNSSQKCPNEHPDFLNVNNHSCLSVQWEARKYGKKKKKNALISKPEQIS